MAFVRVYDTKWWKIVESDKNGINKCKNVRRLAGTKLVQRGCADALHWENLLCYGIVTQAVHDG